MLYLFSRDREVPVPANLFNTSVPMFSALSLSGNAITVSIEGMVGW